MAGTKSIMIVGVGGQGTLLASKVIGRVLTRAGYDVKVSEVHGMSQRGGSVVTYVRYGQRVASPVVELGEADVILAFEELEAARYLPFLKAGGKIIVGRRQMEPMPVIIGAAKYPSDIVSKLREKGAEVVSIDALALAEEAGSAKAVNVVLLGVFARDAGFERASWEEALTFCVPQKFLELNMRAFERALTFSFI